jgi:hypothetical protein
MAPATTFATRRAIAAIAATAPGVRCWLLWHFWG